MGNARYLDGKTWVQTWARADIALADVRTRELRDVDLAAFIHATSSLFAADLARGRLRQTSDIAEFQRAIHRSAP